MKKLLISMAVIAFLVACGGSGDSGGNANNPPSNNGNQNEAKNGKDSCINPVADDGSSPAPLPGCK